MKKIILIIFLIFNLFPSAIIAAQKDDFKAAFVRKDNLWIKVNKREIQLTNDSYVRYPKWSFDGSWVAYLKRTKDIDVFDLWLYHVKSNQHYRVKENVSDNFEWSPTNNRIGFQVNNNLFILNTGQLGTFTPIAKDIKNFSWLPAGNGLLISSKKSPDLQSDIILSKVTFRKNSKPIISHFYTIPIPKNEIFVSTSEFKWSTDKKWISFLLVPTASLSADGNTLCVLSADGKTFQRVDEMLNEEAWFQWAPFKGLLGYISGVGREATVNKQLQIVTVPSMQKETFTSKGFVDRDLFWKNNQTVYVARSKESSEGDLSQRPMPSLYKISLTNHKQIKVTSPSGMQGDFRPQILKNNLFWIRTDRETANVLVSPTYQMNERVWIKNINTSSSSYERYNWDEVFSLYTMG